MRPIVIRADGAGGIGMGHIKRCVEIARVLRMRGATKPVFYSVWNWTIENLLASEFGRRVWSPPREESDVLQEIISLYEGPVVLLDTLYPYEITDIVRMRKAGCKVIVMQNECDGMYTSDYTIFPDHHHALGWLPGQAQILQGLDYVIINRTAKEACRHREAGSHIAVVAGASDPWGVLPEMARLFREIGNPECVLPPSARACGPSLLTSVKFLVGEDAHYKTKMADLCEEPYMVAVPFNYADLFSAQMAVTVFGCTAYELIYAEVPLMALGPNERYANYARVLAQRTGTLDTLDWPCTSDDLKLALSSLWGRRWDMVAVQHNLIDGLGAERIADLILQEAQK